MKYKINKKEPLFKKVVALFFYLKLAPFMQVLFIVGIPVPTLDSIAYL